jgi:uncharacterized protein (DUF58 family)
MPRAGDLVFPLIPSRRSRALEIAGRASRRRGSGDEIAGSRPYRRGDAIRLIDWAASARLSTARGSDEFVVRDHFAEDAIRAVVVLDRGPTMALFPESLPWLHKPLAARAAAGMIVASAVAANGLVGFAAAGAADVRINRPRRDRDARRVIEDRLRDSPADGPEGSVNHALDALLRRRSNGVPPGTFVFVVSDFLPGPSTERLRAAIAAGWDVVPVVVQDPLWERSFPDVAGVTLPLVDPLDGRLAFVRLSRDEARARRKSNEERAELLGRELVELGLDSVLLTTSDPRAIHGEFTGWAEGRAVPARARP